MRRRLVPTLAAVLLALGGAGLTACGEDDVRDAGQEIESEGQEAVEDAESRAREAAEEAERKAREAAEGN